MPHLQRFWNENQYKGLHVFHVESQNHEREKIEAFCKEKGVTFPQTLRSGSEFSGFSGFSGLPYAFVVGVDGKVIWEGRSGYLEVVAKELEKVRYPGLGKLAVAEDAHKAASLFGARQYANAIEEARDLLEDEPSAEAKADAEYIIARAEKVAESTKARIAEAREDEDFLVAMDLLAELGKTFKGHEVGDWAREEHGALKKDKHVKKSVQADATWEKLKPTLHEMSAAEQRKLLEGFLKKFEGTRAGRKAQEKLDVVG